MTQDAGITTVDGGETTVLLAQAVLAPVWTEQAYGFAALALLPPMALSIGTYVGYHQGNIEPSVIYSFAGGCCMRCNDASQ